MENSFNIGERIRELRTIRGLSQEQLALRSDITPTYLGQIERNAKNPTVKIIEQLCQTLGLGLPEFFSPTVPAAFMDELLSRQLISQLNSRSPEEKRLLLQIIRNTLQLRDLSEDKDGQRNRNGQVEKNG